jgi:hypothetical protein
MKWKVAALAVVATIIAILGGMYYVAGTPQYSLYLVRRSIRENDANTFFAHFDQERVIQNAIARAVGGVPAGPDIVSRQAHDVAIPTGKRVLEDRIFERLENPGTIPMLDATIESVDYNGKAAIVTLRLPDGAATTSLVLERMPDRHWKIVDLDLAKADITFSLNDMM